MSLKISTGTKARANRVLLYGVEGIGKTTLFAKTPGTFIIDTEGGSHSLDCARADVESLHDLIEVFNYIGGNVRKGQFEYKIIVIDTVDKVWEWCAAAVVEEAAASNSNGKKIESIEDIPYGKGYAMASEKFNRTIIGGMNKIAGMGLHVVACAHSKIARIAPPDNQEYNQYQVKISAPNTQAAEAANLMRQNADAVLFCHFDTIVRTDRNKSVGKAIGEERVISTTHSAQWEAKNRIGLPETMPMEPASLVPLFPDLSAPSAPASTTQGGLHITTGTAPQPEEEDDTTEPSGADPRNLGGYERHHNADADLPEILRGHERELVAYLQRKGQLRAGATVADISENMKARIQANPQAVLAAITK